MSIESLLAQEPTCTLVRMTMPGDVDAGGVQVEDPLIDVGPISGRLMDLDARQKEAWHSLGVEATYIFESTDKRPRASMYIRSFDGRFFRIVGDQNIEYKKGNIRPDTYDYPMVEETTGSGGASHG